MLVPLVLGVLIGVSILLALAVIFGARGSEKTWRGAANAVAVGLALGALFDVMPLALEQATVVIGSLLRELFIDQLALQGSPLGMGGVVLTQAVVPVGALLVLFLYLTGNTVPMMVDGKLVGVKTTGWRARLMLPEAGAIDWRGIVLLTVGLAVHNLWVGQYRGALVAPADAAVNLFFYSVALVGALRGLALFGPFVYPARRWLPFLGCALLIGAAVVCGVLFPATKQTLLLGVLPACVAVIVLPIAMGRLLRAMQNEIGLNWQATLIVVVTLAVERASSMLLVQMAQGRI